MLHTFDNLETAQTFFTMPELKQTIEQAGVEDDSITISFYDEVKSPAR